MSDDLKGWGKNDLIREVRKLRALLGEQMSAAPGIGTEVTVEGIVSVTSGKPIVRMRAGEAAWQMTPADARAHALVTLNAAVEAERDAAVIAFLSEMGDEAGETEDQKMRAAAGFLEALRTHRTDWLAELKA